MLHERIFSCFIPHYGLKYFIYPKIWGGLIFSMGVTFFSIYVSLKKSNNILH